MTRRLEWWVQKACWSSLQRLFWLPQAKQCTERRLRSQDSPRIQPVSDRSLAFWCRYEELKKQLAEAQEAAQLEDEEAEVARAESMLARLTTPALAAAGRFARREALASPGLASEGAGNRSSSVVSSWLLASVTDASPLQTANERVSSHVALLQLMQISAGSFSLVLLDMFDILQSAFSTQHAAFTLSQKDVAVTHAPVVALSVGTAA